MKYNIGDILVEHLLNVNIKFFIQIIEIKHDEYCYKIVNNYSSLYYLDINKTDNNKYEAIEYRKLTNEEKLELL